MDRKARTHNADRTHALIQALKALEGTNFEKLMGSGMLIRITPITDGKEFAEEFLVPAEDMTEIATPLAASLRKLLERRKVRLALEIRNIEDVLGKK